VSLNTFGNANFNTNATFTPGLPNGNIRDTQYSNNTPGPPFHLSNVNSINMNAHNASYMPPQVSAQAGLGASTTQDFTPAGYAFPADDMDLSGDRVADQPSPATISSQSRGGSTSHSSYSPGQQTEHHLPYRASPKPGFNNLNAQMPVSTSFPPFSAAPAGVEMFSNAFSTTGVPADEAFNHGFLMGNEWEYGAMNAGSGMTPMSDGSWNQMLENVTMGWDGTGTVPGQGDTGE
jgi:hypothetical protein